MADGMESGEEYGAVLGRASDEESDRSEEESEEESAAPPTKKTKFSKQSTEEASLEDEEALALRLLQG
jgi:hypothetical protein